MQTGLFSLQLPEIIKLSQQRSVILLCFSFTNKREGKLQSKHKTTPYGPTQIYFYLFLLWLCLTKVPVTHETILKARRNKRNHYETISSRSSTTLSIIINPFLYWFLSVNRKSLGFFGLQVSGISLGHTVHSSTMTK